jgi:hypothetical protein
LVLQALSRVAVLIAIFAACGKKDAVKSKDDAAAKPVAAPIAIPTLGVDKIGRFNFIYDDGRPAYDKARAAAKTKDWATVKTQCEAALAKDPGHLDAHRLLATALAQTGDPAAAVDHLVTALAADYYAYGPELAADKDLAAFLATPQGQAVTSLAQQIHDEYGKRIPGALWVVGRRSPFRWPDKSGVQYAYTRGELYAYDRDSKRYFRLTHTDHQVLGFMRGGDETAILGFDKVDHPSDGDPSFVRPWLQIQDTDGKLIGKRITLPAGKQLALGYGAGGALIVAVDGAAQSVDKTTGKLTKISGALPVPRIEATLEEGRLVRMPDGVEAAWSGDPPVTGGLKVGATTISVPESGLTAQTAVALAPGGARIAFSTAVDPCAKDTAPSLYVADTKTGALKHLLTARSRFDTRWLDGNVLAYEDGDGAIRLWDATTGREAIRLDERGGLALDVLSLAPAPVCKQAPPAEAGSGSAEEPLPPEEGSAGPVTNPQ